MHAKEIKQALKEVREFIKNKQINPAIEKCEEVLKEEPKNYMALVLMGAAYQDKDKKEAAKYLREAVSSSSDPTVALQGLANCAEPEELPNIYRKLLKLVPDKYQDYHKKIVTASCNNNNLQDCIDILKDETNLENNEANTKRIASAWKNLALILIKQDELSNSTETLLKPALEAALTDKETENYLECYKRYLKLLYKIKDYEKLLSIACTMTEEFPQDVYPLEWICKVYSENIKSENLNVQDFLKEPIAKYAESLLKLSKTASLGLLVKAITLVEASQYVQARDLLLQVKQMQPNFSIALEFLSQIYINLGAYSMAINIFKQLKQKNLDYAMCLSYSSSAELLNEAVQLLNDYLTKSGQEEKTKIQAGLVRCYFQLEKFNEALEQINSLKDQGAVQIASIIEAEFSSTEESLNILEAINDENNFEVNFLKGKKYFEAKKYDLALTCLLKATRLKPYFSECFEQLGRVYAAINDMGRAQKCFEKCSNLNPHNEAAVCHLSAIYRKNENSELNVALLQNVLKHLEGPQSKWALFQLGLHYLNIKKYDDAIHSLRTALRYDINYILCWEALADSYQQRGSYNSAMRVYQKILELDPNNIYAKLQIANLKTILRMYTEAINWYKEILAEKSDYLPALKGSAEAHYGMALYLLPQRLLGRCKDHLQLAVNQLQKAFLVGKRNMIWLWRLIANIFVMVACMPTSKAFLKVSGQLAGQEEDEIMFERKELFEFAARFYTCALKLQPEDTFLWHELSLCYYNFALHNDDNSIKLKHMTLALDASKQSIKTQPDRWQNWNLYGVINATKEINDLAMAQHCFIKALQIERKSAITWTNLGVLYLTQNSIKLANQAFQKAQQSNPSFVNAWIGQATIAEKIGECEEAMDLYRHCTQLEFHVESALGYAHWVSTILSDPENLKDPKYQYAIEKMHALPVALDSMNWYVNAEDDKSSVESLTYLGYLNSRYHLWRPAIQAFRNALKKAVTTEQKDRLICNLGYAYLKNEQYQDAIDTFNSMSEATLKSTIGVALAYLHAGQSKESYSIYSSALEWLAVNEEEKSVILAAMAPMVYSALGEAQTKTILFQCIALSNAPIQAFFAACSLGILHKDFQLSETILEELRRYEDDKEYCHHIAFLKAQLYFTNNEVRRGLVHLMCRVHTFPGRPLLRKVLANYVLQNCKKNKQQLASGSRIAEGVLLLNLKSCKRQTALEAAKFLCIASESMKKVNKVKRSRLAQKAIHLHPTCQVAWNILNDCKVITVA